MDREAARNPEPLPGQHEQGSTYGDICMSGNAQSFLGNAYIYNYNAADKQGDREQERMLIRSWVSIADFASSAQIPVL